jgi:tripartite-type tricarboxylate transporter receptor subunit TctC
MSAHLPDRRMLLAGGASLLAMPSVAGAQAVWPAGRQIRIVVPFPPAGATDVLGRIMADRFGEYWGTRVLVENKAGAGGNIGTEQVAKAAPDGDTILIVSVGMATNPYLYAKLNYDQVKDFDPVSLIAMVPNVLVAGRHTPYSSVAELVAYARANPGKITYGSSGIGTSVHLSGELFAKLTGAPMQHVPYRGTALAMQDLMGGRIDIIFDNITAAVPQVNAGTVKALGITTARRSPFAPQLAPVNDALPGFDVTSWFAFFVPKGTPEPVIRRIEADVKKALGEASVKEKMAALGAESVGSTPAELAAFLRAEGDRWGRLINEVGIKAGG